MQSFKHVAQTAIWVNLLANMDKRPRLIGILQSSAALSLQFSSCCRQKELRSFCCKNVSQRQLLGETIAASGCDTLICDRHHYDLLIYILSLQPKAMTVILNQECWTPDWCWQLPRHHFLCQQDLE